MEELEKHAKWETIYKCRRESGLVLFEPDGIIIDEETGETENVGVEYLIDLSTRTSSRLRNTIRQLSCID
jgi:hypothetical protein